MFDVPERVDYVDMLIEQTSNGKRKREESDPDVRECKRGRKGKEREMTIEECLTQHKIGKDQQEVFMNLYWMVKTGIPFEHARAHILQSSSMIYDTVSTAIQNLCEASYDFLSQGRAEERAGVEERIKDYTKQQAKIRFMLEFAKGLTPRFFEEYQKPKERSPSPPSTPWTFPTITPGTYTSVESDTPREVHYHYHYGK